jgi:pyruvate dehydrogenase E2 component (dihydrolipoamide acetyltransferase)
LATEKITVPDLGDASEVEVIELLVAVGDKVEENDSLLVLESDKAAMEIPAPMAGVVKSIEVNLGDQVSSGSPMLTLEVGDSASPAPAEDAPAEEPATETREAPKQEASEAPSETAAGNQSASDNASVITISVPDLGTEDEVEIIEVHVAAGDTIDVDDPLITLESDKAAMEVPSTSAGTVEEVLIAVGGKVKTGADILKLKTSSVAVGQPAAEQKQDANAQAAAAEKPAPTPAAIAPPPAEPVAAAAPSAPTGGKVYAGPAVRKLARELGVDLAQVKGSGARSRIVKEDVHEYVKSRINAPATGGLQVSAVPDIDFSQFGEIEQVPRSKLQKVTAANMQRNWSSVPHVAQFNEADVTDLEDFRAQLKAEADKRGTKLTPLPFLLKAVAKALAEYPQFNVSLHSSGEYVIQKKYYHIGMAVATPAGLVVPVIRDVDKKSVWDLSTEIIELSNKARDRKLSLEEMQGACFTISSLGALGGTGFIPIINAPEVAILGVSKTEIKPVFIDGEFQPRKILPFTLCYDHKAVNGLDGGMFADYLARVLSDIRQLIL